MAPRHPGGRPSKRILATAAPLLLLLLASGCLDSEIVRIDEPVLRSLGWTSTDLRVLDPRTYETGPKRPEREPAIAINPTNPLNVIAVNTEEILEPYTSWLRFFTSFDGGESWTEIRELHQPQRPGAVGDPSLAFDADGVAYFAYLDAQGVGIDRSHDGGRTWTLAAETATRGEDPATGRCSSPDKQLITVDRATGTLYLVWTRFSHECSADEIPGHATVNHILLGDLRLDIVLSRSTDQGETWSAPEVIYDRAGIGAVPVVGPDGQVHVTFWGSLETNERNTYCASDYSAVVSGGKEQHGAIVVASSPPGGEGPWRVHVEPICHLNFGPAILATTGAYTWAGHGFITPTATIDPLHNTLHVAFVGTALGELTPNIFEIHSDGGVKSWSQAAAVGGTETMDGFLPALAADNGNVHLIYSQRTTERGYAEFYRSSNDKGATWSEPKKLSSQDYELTTDNIGDYNWIDASGGRVAAIWTGTDGPGQMQVWSRVGNLPGASAQ